MEKTILQYIEDNKWDKIIKLIKDKKFVNVNTTLINGNNLFHLACINLKSKIIKTLLDMKNKKQIKLNTNLLNSDGIPGIHLYYKYGGTDLSILDKAIICHIDIYSNTILNYVLYNPELLENFVDKMIESKCITNLYFIIDVNKTFFTKLTEKINTCIKEDINKYKNIMKKIYTEVKPINFINITIYENSIYNLTLLFGEKYNFLTYELHELPLATAIKFNKLTMIILILQYTENTFGLTDVNKMIHSSKYDYDNYPIILAITTENYGILYILKKYMEKILDKDIDIYYDSRHNTYLHRLLLMNNIHENIEILKFFVKHTNLTKKNYMGYSCSYMLFATNLWLNVIDELKGREMDLTDIEHFIDEKDINLFDTLKRTIKEPFEIKNTRELNKLFGVRDIKNILNINQKNIVHYGIYDAKNYDRNIYLKYLQNLDLYLPSIKYDIVAQSDFIYTLEMNVIANNRNLINEVKNLALTIYTLLPAIILWQNKNHYFSFLENDNENILKNNTKRFIYIYIVILNTNVYVAHANCFIYDTKTNNGYLFEPYGMTDVYTDDNEGLDELLINIFKKEFGKVNYYYPEDYMKNINFQLVSKDGLYHIKNIGDPGGYCLAWCIWFGEILIKHPDTEISLLMKNFINRENINLLLTENDIKTIKSNNYYLDFIRLYGQKLTNEKNKILLNMGVTNYELYKNIYSDDTKFKIKNYVNQ